MFLSFIGFFKKYRVYFKCTEGINTLKGYNMRKRWTPKEDLILTNTYENNTKETILKTLSKDWASICRRARRINLHRNEAVISLDKKKRGPRKDRWTPEDDSFLKKIYPNSTKKEILLQIARSWRAIINRARYLNLNRNLEIIKKEMIEGGKNAPPTKDSWKESEIKILKKIYKSSYKKDILQKIDRSWMAIRLKAKSLGLKRDKGLIKEDNILGNKNANLKNNGVEYSTLLPSMKEKSRNTNIKKREVEYPTQSKEVKEKVKNTVIKKYGVNNVFQSEEIKEKTRKTVKEKYGTDYATQNLEVKQKIINTAKENGSFEVSDEESTFYLYLKEIDPQTEPQVLNPVTKSAIDFYMPNYNLWVQYDGDYWHGKIKGKKETPREIKIRETVKRDKKQNLLIPNLIRFSSGEVIKSIDEGNLKDLINKRISKKSSKDLTCHQHRVKLSSIKEDLKNLDFNHKTLKASDFTFLKENYNSNINKFIKKYEWLGTVGTTPKWCFTASYKGTLAGVVLINEPNSYSKLLGEDTPKYEALIQRGASASWTPKNLGSKLIMFSCRWMVNNTAKRMFIGYGDPKAHEIGTIYQACNFDYLGDTFGSGFIYYNPKVKRGKAFSEQSLKRTSSFKSWCKTNSIHIQKEWIKENGYKNLKTIPKYIKEEWYKWIKGVLKESYKIPLAKKHKYALIVCKDKREKKLISNLKTYKTKGYPKRGDVVKPSSEHLMTINIRVNNEKPQIKYHNSRITPEKDLFIIKNYKTMTQKEIAMEIKETTQWVSKRIRNLISIGKLSSKKPVGITKSRVTDNKINFIIKNRNKMTYNEMAEHLSETKRWIKRQINKINKS